MVKLRVHGPRRLWKTLKNPMDLRTETDRDQARGLCFATKAGQGQSAQGLGWIFEAAVG